MFEGWRGAAGRTTLIAARPIRNAAGILWRHSFRFITLLLVGAVIFTAARQVPAPGTRSSQTPAVSEAMPPPPPPVEWPRQYAWLSRRGRTQYEPLVSRIPSPTGYVRVNALAGSFAEWLRHLPAAPNDRAVTNARRQTVMNADDARVAAVIDLQPGAGNLLTSAAILVRLRAEYLWTIRDVDRLAFKFTSGHTARWADWAAGLRPNVRGKEVTFKKETIADDSRDNFCGYLETLFRYTTVYSLIQQMTRPAPGTIGAGDVFILTGKNPHAIMVLDAARSDDGRVKVLLGQGGNPAQTFHVLRADDGDPWFSVSLTNGITLRGRQLRLKDLYTWPE